MRRFDDTTRYDRNATVTPGLGVLVLTGAVAALVPVAALVMVDHPRATAGLVLGAGLLYLEWHARRGELTPARGHAAAAVRSIVWTPYRWLGPTGEGAPEQPASRR